MEGVGSVSRRVNPDVWPKRSIAVFRCKPSTRFVFKENSGVQFRLYQHERPVCFGLQRLAVPASAAAKFATDGMTG